jgi:5-methylcytosine-specific restriction protein A
MPERAPRQRTATPPRKSAAERGYGRRWQAARLEHLAREPLCRVCWTVDAIATPATVVDHIEPPESRMDPLFWRRSNWQSLCKKHHDAKTLQQSVRGRQRR